MAGSTLTLSIQVGRSARSRCRTFCVSVHGGLEEDIGGNEFVKVARAEYLPTRIYADAHHRSMQAPNRSRGTGDRAVGSASSECIVPDNGIQKWEVSYRGLADSVGARSSRIVNLRLDFI